MWVLLVVTVERWEVLKGKGVSGRGLYQIIVLFGNSLTVPSVPVSSRTPRKWVTVRVVEGCTIPTGTPSAGTRTEGTRWDVNEDGGVWGKPSASGTGRDCHETDPHCSYVHLYPGGTRVVRWTDWFFRPKESKKNSRCHFEFSNTIEEFSGSCIAVTILLMKGLLYRPVFPLPSLSFPLFLLSVRPSDWGTRLG